MPASADRADKARERATHDSGTTGESVRAHEVALTTERPAR